MWQTTYEPIQLHLLHIYPTIPNPHYDYIEILYVGAPEGVKLGEYRDITAGEPIGIALDLEKVNKKEYKGVPPHAHIQLRKGKTLINPTPFFRNVDD